MPVKRRRCIGKRRAHILDHDLWNRKRQLALHQQRHRALLHRLRRKIMTVDLQARRARKQRARLYLSGIIENRADLNLAVAD